MKIKRLGIVILVCLLLLIGCCENKDVVKEKNEVELKEDIKLKEEDELEETSIVSDIDLTGMKIYGLNTNDKNLKLLPTNIKAIDSTEDYLLGIRGLDDEKNKILYKSKNGAKTWTKVKIFDKAIKGLHVNSRDEVFVSIGTERGEKEDSELFVAENIYGDFKKVLDIKSGITRNWNMASDNEGYMFLSEYGIKDVDNNPRRIYRSKDWGRTWEIVYEPEVRTGYHNHVIHIDENNLNHIYQIIGDDIKYLLKSEDRGESWKIVDEGYHPTSVIQIDNYLLYGLDAVPFSGFKLYDTLEDKVVRDSILEKPRKGSIYDLVMINDVIYAGTTSYYYHDFPANLLVSEDFGNSWKTIAEIELPEDLGASLEHFVEHKGDLYIGGGYPIIVRDEIKWCHGTIKYKMKE